MANPDHGTGRPRRRAAVFVLATTFAVVACGSEAPPPGTSRAEAVAEAIEDQAWDRAYALIEGSEASRVEKNAIKAAVLYRRGDAAIAEGEYGTARLAFIEARRLSGNPAFWYDEARAWRGMRNRKLERQFLTKYLRALPNGPNAEASRARLRRIALKPIKRKTPRQLAAEEAREARKKRREAARAAKRSGERDAI